MRRTLVLLLGLARLAVLADAHTIFTTLYINDVSQGDGTCVRMNRSPSTCTSPVDGIRSKDMACGANGQEPVAFTCPAPAGAKLTFQWRLWANAEQPGVIDESHKGPCAVYAKQLDDMTKGSAAGPGWFKLWDEGYDEEAGLWCTEKLMRADGLLSVRIPAGLPAGNWLFRPELLALQNAHDGDPQFYVGCAQVFVESADAPLTLSVPADRSVSIPGHVAAGDPGLTYNIYSNKPKLPYPVPGPAVFVPPSSSSSSSVSAAADNKKAPSSVTRQRTGRVPADYLIKNANWGGVEVAAYSTEAGCWAAAEDCWAQADACYDAAPPSGNRNCRVWERKCRGINDACEAGDYRDGPPAKGVRLVSEEPGAPARIPAAVNEGQDGRGREGKEEEEHEDEGRGGRGGGDGDGTSEAAPAPTETVDLPDWGAIGGDDGPVIITVTEIVTAPAAATQTSDGRRARRGLRFR
ncbi:hypothetical protein DL767_006277 [Monosporascus sp. MG133]|nr:hypothetical protein DL767_006277 [Monosporascus sp. MG133]